MSREDAEAVRQPLALTGNSRRRLEDRLALRFPRTLALLYGAIWRLPPQSRLRRGALRLVAQRGLEAANRGDIEAAFALYHPDVEMISPPELVQVGFESRYRGREARIGVQRRWVADWGEFRFVPEELIDLGDGRVLVVGRMNGSGLSSGAEFDNDWALLVTVSAGRIVREQPFFDRRRALEAVQLAH